MNRRTRLVAGGVVSLALLAPGATRAQIPTDGVRPPDSPRLQLPFSVDVDRLPGPPRAVGELPLGESQPPSTLPGRPLGSPPRAMGEAPELPPVFLPEGPSLPRFLPGVPSVDLLSPFSTSIPFSPFTVPLMVRPGGRGGEEEGPSGGAGNARDSGRREATPRPTSPGTPEAARPPALRLEQVLASAERTYPPFLAILQERNVARGGFVEAQGPFDLRLDLDSRNWPLGFYRRSVQTFFVEQPIMNVGGKIFGGYRYAEGLWPIYYNYLNTLSGGAFVGGLELPILQNREIDAKRAKLMQMEIERRKVEPVIAKERIELFKNAAKVYWGWVAAGRAYVVYKDLVRVAEYRNAGLDRQVREGIVRPIELVDFRRILVSRQQQEITAKRRFEQAGIELSLYLRDNRCLPVFPDPQQLPLNLEIPPAPDPKRYQEDVEVALRLRPEVLKLRLQAQKAQIDRQYAVNQMQPSLNFYMYTEQNVGRYRSDLNKDDRPFIMEASLLFEVPLQRRGARGRIIQADAVLRQFAAESQYLTERIRADVADGYSNLRATYQLLTQARENLALARRLEEAERVLLREGSSTVLFLNLREQSTSDAKVYVVEAESKYLSAIAEFRYALGLDAAPPGVLPPQ